MLTDSECREATCPPDKARARLTDASGLYLEVSPAGSKRWFWKTYADGKEGRLALGSYPKLTLKAARKARDAAKLQKSEGVDPVQLRKVEKLKATRTGGDTFKAVALDWYGKQSSQWSASHAERSLRQLERDLFPWIGERLMVEIHPMELLAALQKVEERGAIETADRVLMLARQVWDYWLPTAQVQQRNITEGLKGRLTPYRGKTFAAILDPVRMGGLMRAIKGYKGGPIVRTALQLTPLLYQRPGNLRMMEWAELDLDGALWTIPSMKMKRTKLEKEQGEAHTVPLPTQAVALLRSIHPLTGHGRYVFPGERSHDRPVSDNSVRSALYALGFGKEQSWHGFRASARTMLVDELDIDYNVIEANLAHAVKDANGRSYNRTQYVKQRFVMIQQWADYLDKLATGGDVIQFKAA
ncbi:MAG: integrase arm-type DNA-binding domain-containing protein [Polaromonas sp.]|uniref:tyrosine-type recombinase/integrase n=1 Tax=Polaromonas sp. TaxID=1869339 RepID=UPI0017C51B2E|nr:integrase arm-type DNA-binding domain-containing protein [Polaromonas sp.]NMM10937.1 integrase arm-type DNA-binding domain-containing protein [Polaromonas sp.]